MNNNIKENLEISVLACENEFETGANINLCIALDRFNKNKIKEKILEANLGFTPLHFFCGYKKNIKLTEELELDMLQNINLLAIK